jgi:hypothetical protein
VGRSPGRGEGSPNARKVEFNPAATPELRLERFNTLDVMHPGEMEMLTEDLIADLLASGSQNAPELVQAFVLVVRGFYQDWKSLWSYFGAGKDAWAMYERRRNRVLDDLQAIPQPLVLNSNGTIAQKIMRSRVLVACVNKPIPGTSEIQFAR